MILSPQMRSNFRHMGNIIAVVAGLLMLVVGNTLDGRFGDTVRYLLRSPMQAPVAAPAPDLELPVVTGSDSKTQSSPEKAAPTRDWVDVTDKLVDWFAKIVGSLTTLLGVVGLTRSKAEPAKSVILLPDDKR